MKVKDLIMKLIYCDPDKDVRGLFYEFQDEEAVEHELNLKHIEEFDNDIELIFEDLKLHFNQSENKTFDYLRKKIIDWGKSKDLLHEENAEKQFLKFMEEIFEFRDEWTLYKDEFSFNNGYGEIDDNSYLCELADKMILEMGDIFVTLIILCEQLEMDPVDCLGRAYEKIKDRKGKTINGVFIKQEDLKGDLK